LPIVKSVIDKITKPDLIGRIRKKILRRNGRSFGASYLDSYGWQASQKEARPIDESGKPVPWYTYPTLSVLTRIVSAQHRVFEYGCGNSSLWWAAHAQSVISVEHHPEWAAKISAQAPSNATVLLKEFQSNEAANETTKQFIAKNPNLPLSGNRTLDIEHGLLTVGFSDYATEITKYPAFDIIVVDGMARSLCAWIAAHCLKPDGFIVFDNSDRWQYNPGYQALAGLGFGRVDFWGPGPVNDDPWCTSIFFRTTKWSLPLITVDPKRKTALDWMIEAAKT